MEYEIVTGLEIHAQLLTKTKMFCGCGSVFGGDANTRGCPVCLGMPGSLPVLNRSAVEMAVRMGLAVGSEISPLSVFARKNYFYPDLPKGYQISQYDKPLCIGGSIPITLDGIEKQIKLTRIHLEEDAGKLIHDQDPDSLFDVNRCGTPLMEIVSEPDMHSAAEAVAYFMSIKQILEYLGICDCNMEEASLRCDANISLRPKGETKLGTKTEIKNMNSFKALEKSIETEVGRQKEILLGGGRVVQETLDWDASTSRLVSLRSKEDAHDYRYFPDPDLVPLVIDKLLIEHVKTEIPELPSVRRKRFELDKGLSPYAAEVLTSSRALADYFEDVLKTYNDPRTASNWIMGDILRICNEQKIAIEILHVTPKRLGSLIRLIENGTVSSKAARRVFDLMQEQDKDPEKIIEEQGLQQMSDTNELESIVKQVLESNSKEVERYRAGEKKLTSFFVGQIMKVTKGRGNPKEINCLLSKLLGS